MAMERRGLAGGSAPISFKDLTDAQLESKLRIDQNALEDVCKQHPELLYEAAKRLARLISERDEAKQTLKEREAEADAKIRHDAEVAGDKVTEKVVESQKLLDRTVLAAKDKMFELEKQVGQMAALKEAFQSRGYAIRDLIQLYIANYYGSDMERSRGNMRSAHASDARQQQGRIIRQGTTIRE